MLLENAEHAVPARATQPWRQLLTDCQNPVYHFMNSRAILIHQHHIGGVRDQEKCASP